MSDSEVAHDLHAQILLVDDEVDHAEVMAEALRRVGTNLVGSAGLLTLFPGGFSPEASQISVPVFIAAGDHDLHTAQRTPPAFPKSPEVIAYSLPDCWHCHFVARQRLRLWDRSARWTRGLVANLS